MQLPLFHVLNNLPSPFYENVCVFCVFLTDHVVYKSNA